MRYIALILCIGLLVPASVVFAKSSPVTVSKTIEGTVDTIRASYITIIYKEDKDSGEEVVKDYEAVFPVDANTKFAYKKTLSEFAQGDKVEIIYDETSWVDENGIGRVERVARQIRFIRSALKGLRSGE